MDMFVLCVLVCCCWCVLISRDALAELLIGFVLFDVFVLTLMRVCCGRVCFVLLCLLMARCVVAVMRVN